MKSLIALPRPLIAALPLLVACGGAQTTTAAAAPRPAAPVVAPAPPTPAPRPDPRQKLMWVVFFDEVQALTIYPVPGTIRAEVAATATPGFEGTSRYFSVYSNYQEREADFAPVLHAATSLDDLLARLAAMPQVRVQELENPVFATP